jgi:hypothetical protein
MAGAVKELDGVVPPKAIDIGVTAAVIVKGFSTAKALLRGSLRYG